MGIFYFISVFFLVYSPDAQRAYFSGNRNFYLNLMFYSIFSLHYPQSHHSSLSAKIYFCLFLILSASSKNTREVCKLFGEKKKMNRLRTSQEYFGTTNTLIDIYLSLLRRISTKTETIFDLGPSFYKG
jgi:hypothetical protein